MVHVYSTMSYFLFIIRKLSIIALKNSIAVPDENPSGSVLA